MKENINQTGGQSNLVWEWFRDNFLHPCGETPEEQAYMRRMHEQVIKDNLEDPNVRNGLSSFQKSILRIFNLYEEE